MIKSYHFHLYSLNSPTKEGSQHSKRLGLDIFLQFWLVIAGLGEDQGIVESNEITKMTVT